MHSPQCVDLVPFKDNDQENMVIDNSQPQCIDLVPFQASVLGSNMVIEKNQHQCMNMVQFQANGSNMVIDNNQPQCLDLFPSGKKVQGNNMIINNNQPKCLDLIPIEKDVPRNKVIRPIATKRARYEVTGNYTCDSPQCPYHCHQVGFHNKELRDYHQINCPYRSNSSSN